MGRMRSPNFPGLPLEDAIKFVKIIWDKNRRAPISREAGAKDLGYTGLTGRSLQVLGALNQYDLIENLTKGQMRVTSTAEQVLIGFPETVKRAAVTTAGRAPSLYREIYDRFEGHIPGENAVRSFLFQRGFTNEGVEKALKTFIETNRYVEIFGDSESYGNDAEGGPESASPIVEPDNIIMEHTATEVPTYIGRKPQFYGGEGTTVSKRELRHNEVYLDIRGSREVHVEGILDYEGILDLEDKLKALKLLIKKPPPKATEAKENNETENADG